MNTYVFVYKDHTPVLMEIESDEVALVTAMILTKMTPLERVLCAEREVWRPGTCYKPPAPVQVCTTKNPCEGRIDAAEDGIDIRYHSNYKWWDLIQGVSVLCTITYCPFCGTKLEE